MIIEVSDLYDDFFQIAEILWLNGEFEAINKPANQGKPRHPAFVLRDGASGGRGSSSFRVADDRLPSRKSIANARKRLLTPKCRSPEDDDEQPARSAGCLPVRRDRAGRFVNRKQAG
jgi:hypothetical protein